MVPGTRQVYPSFRPSQGKICLEYPRRRKKHVGCKIWMVPRENAVGLGLSLTRGLPIGYGRMQDTTKKQLRLADSGSITLGSVKLSLAVITD